MFLDCRINDVFGLLVSGVMRYHCIQVRRQPVVQWTCTPSSEPRYTSIWTFDSFRHWCHGKTILVSDSSFEMQIMATENEFQDRSHVLSAVSTFDISPYSLWSLQCGVEQLCAVSWRIYINLFVLFLLSSRKRETTTVKIPVCLRVSFTQKSDVIKQRRKGNSVHLLTKTTTMYACSRYMYDHET